MTPHIRGLLRPGHESPSEHTLTTWWIYATPLRGRGAVKNHHQRRRQQRVERRHPADYPRHTRLVALLE